MKKLNTNIPIMPNDASKLLAVEITDAWNFTLLLMRRPSADLESPNFFSVFFT